MDKELEKLVAAHEADIHAAPSHRVQQWHDTIDTAAALERGRTAVPRANWHPTSFFWGAAVTAALAIGIGIGFIVSGESDPAPTGSTPLVASTTAQAKDAPAAFARGLQVHLRNSRQQITNLGDGTDRSRLLLQIIGQNRMFEMAAEQNNSPKLARVLRAFEPILLQLAASDIAPEDAAALRAQLAFELNVMLTKLATESSDRSETT